MGANMCRINLAGKIHTLLKVVARSGKEYKVNLI